MRRQDKVIFLEAARKFQLWILVRRTNVHSLEYIGRPGYCPKRIDCKAKTADSNVGSWTLAGLVANPILHKQGFKPQKLADASRYWREMEPILGGEYTVDEDPKSRHYGALRLNGSYIHGDYDLYDLIDITQPQRNLAAVENLLGQLHMRGPSLLRVQEFVNQRIGSPMIQHGGQAQYADHSEQAIDAFGPNGEDVTILNEFSVRAWFKDRFQGRPILGR